MVTSNIKNAVFNFISIFLLGFPFSLFIKTPPFSKPYSQARNFDFLGEVFANTVSFSRYCDIRSATAVTARCIPSADKPVYGRIIVTSNCVPSACSLTEIEKTLLFPYTGISEITVDESVFSYETPYCSSTSYMATTTYCRT